MSDPSQAAAALRVSGRLRLRVTGASMLPSVWPGDVLTIRAASIDAIPVGSLVLYTRERRLWVHRVHSAAPHALITRGDALAHYDPPVGPDEVLGCVESILHLGRCFAPPRRLSFPHCLLCQVIRRSCLPTGLLLRWNAILARLSHAPRT